MRDKRMRGREEQFVNHSLKHFFIHDVEDSCDGSNQSKDGSPYPFG